MNTNKIAYYPVIVFSLLTFVAVFEMIVVLPLAPSIASIYQVSVADVSLLNIGYAVMGIFAPIGGYIADRFGLKKTMIASMLVFTIGCGILAFNTGLIYYVTGRSVIGMSYFTVIGLISSYTAEVIPENRLGMISGIYKFAFGLSLVVSPVAGSLLVRDYGIQMIYLLLGISGLVVTFMLFFLKSVFVSNERIQPKDVHYLLSQKKTWIYIMMTFFLSVPSVLFYNYYPIKLGTLGLNQVAVGKQFTYLAVGTLVAAVIIIFGSERIGKARLAVIGLVLCTLAMLPMISNQMILLTVFSILLGIGYDIIWGLHMPLCSLVYKKANGTFMTLLTLMMALTNVMVNSIAPIIYRISGFSLHVFLCFISLAITTLLYVKVYYFGKKKPPQKS